MNTIVTLTTPCSFIYMEYVRNCAARIPTNYTHTCERGSETYEIDSLDGRDANL